MLGFITAAFTEGSVDYSEEPIDYSLEEYSDYITLDTNGDRSEYSRNSLNAMLEVRAPAPGYEVISIAGEWKLTRPCYEGRTRMLGIVDYYDGIWV